MCRPEGESGRQPDGNAFRRVTRPESELRTRLLDHVPWMVVSGTSDLDTIRASFAHGASDYLTQPFRDAELIFRVERLIGVPLTLSGGNDRGELGRLETVLTLKERTILDALRANPALKHYPWLYSARGDMLSRLGRHDDARPEFEHAAALTQNERSEEHTSELQSH